MSEIAKLVSNGCIDCDTPLKDVARLLGLNSRQAAAYQIKLYLEEKL